MTGRDCSGQARAGRFGVTTRQVYRPDPLVLARGDWLSLIAPHPSTPPTHAAMLERRGSGRPRLRLVRSIIPFSRKAGATTDNSNTTGLTIAPQRGVRNIRKDAPAMAQTLHPIEAWILKRRVVRKLTLAAFLEDGVLSEKERIALDLIAAEDETIVEFRARQVAAESFVRNGDTRITRDRFRDAGHQLINLDAARAARHANVVAFPAIQKEQA